MKEFLVNDPGNVCRHRRVAGVLPRRLWDGLLYALVIFVVADYITGVMRD